MAYQYKNIVIKCDTTPDDSSRFVLQTKGINPLICIGLNPSKANRIESDLTMNRLENYANKNGFDSVLMFNLYPLRATDPNQLPIIKNQVLYDINMRKIKEDINELKPTKILIACGSDIRKRDYFKEALLEIDKIVKENNIQWLSLGLTKKGFPRHPSRGKYHDLVDFDMAMFLQNI